MFFDGSFFFLRNSIHLYLKNIPAKKKKKKAIQLTVWEEKIFKGFFTLVAMATRIIHGTQLFEGI